MADTHCIRCGAPAQFSGRPPSPEARLVRRAKTPVGHCASCAVANWIQHTEPIKSLIAAKGPSILLDRVVVDQMAEVLKAGCSDASPQEIDWVSVVINWDLPFVEKVRS